MGLVTKNFSDIITFSRGTNATYTDSTGTLQYAEANMLLYSEQFDNAAAWIKQAVTVSPNVTTAPDGTLTADKLVESATTSQHILQQVSTRVASLSYTYSVYAKVAEWTSFQLQLGAGGPIGTFDLVAQTASFGTGATAATIQDVGAGWFRCTVTGPANASSFTYIYKNATSYLGDGVSGIYIWGAQLNLGALQPYNATTGTAYYAPRFDYNPTTLAPLGLLIEEARTNSIRNNTGIGAVVGSPGTLPTGVAVFSANGLTTAVSAVGTTAGINYVDLRFSGTTTSTFYVLSFDNVAATASSGQVWTETFWCALVGGSTTNVSSFVVDLRQVGGAGGTFDVVFTPTTTLNRVASSGTMLVGATGAYGAFVMTFASGVAIDVTLRFGLPQLELGAFATSVIPTASVATTRSADVASINTLSPWYNAAAFTIYSEFNSPVPTTISANAVIAGFDDGTASNRLGNFYSSSTSLVAASQVTAGVLDFSISVGVSTLANVQKQASRFQAGNYATSVNGTAVVASLVAPAPPAVTTLRFGLRPSGTQANMWLRKVTVYPRGLDNATLQAITT